MSGFEIAGVVLGAFPIALHLLDNYREMARRAGLWYKIRLEYAKCRNDVEFQSVTLSSHVRQLILPLLVDDNKMNKLLSDPGGESWKEPAIELLLRDRLGATYDLYIGYIKGMEETMAKLNKELSMDSNPVQDQLNSPKTPVMKTKLRSAVTKAGMEFQLYKVKFSNGEANRTELLVQLQEYNDKLEKLLSTSDRDAQLKKQRTAVQYKTSIDAALCSFWKHASRLFGALASAWNCSCRDQHWAKLLLQHRTDRTAEFDVMFISGSSGWQIQHTKISENDGIKNGPTAQASSPNSMPIHQPAHRQNVAIHLKSAMRVKSNSKTATGPGMRTRTATISKSSITLGSVAVASCSSTPPQPLPFDRQPIHSLCITLHQQQQQQQTHQPSCCGYLTATPDETSSSDCKYYVHTLARHETNMLSTITLDQIMRGGGNASIPPPTRKQRYILALTLASSFLQLLDTPWLPVSWKKTDIIFITSTLSNTSDPHQPYLRRESFLQLNPNNQTAAAPSLAKSLDQLGIVLLELCFGKALEDQPYRKTLPPGRTEEEKAVFDVVAARDWQYDVEEEAGREYFEAVSWCLGGIRPDRWRQDMLRCVVEPLQRCRDFLV
ncbi:hypothetical protein B0H66DRAFT_605559 [Apodospora peruviana]|uniref:DUF7580 domain-containing protein n=1 Tax=Apodospora peruviana TaxID=516989 RepID=A0AAE0M0Q5_9PEZI|nr:hypothetical protein B0H66DRAFT_605559 [Apodospora peruviana]